MGWTLTETVTLTTIECGGCGIAYAVPEGWLNERREDGKSWPCPNRCERQFRERELDRVRRRLADRTSALDRALATATHERDQRQAAERSNIALRGVVTKTRQRVGKGSCPCCNRHFVNVSRHMASQHPDYAASTP